MSDPIRLMQQRIDTLKANERKLLELIENACLEPASREVPKHLAEGFGTYDADGNFIPPAKLPNIPAIMAASEVFERNSADACVLYEELTAISENEAVPESARNSAVRAVSGVTRVKLSDILLRHVNEHLSRAKLDLDDRRRHLDMATGVQLVIDQLEGKTWKEILNSTTSSPTSESSSSPKASAP